MPNRLFLIAAPVLVALSASLALAAPAAAQPGKPGPAASHCAPGAAKSGHGQPCKPGAHGTHGGKPGWQHSNNRPAASGGKSHHQQAPRKALRVGEQLKPAEYRALSNPSRYKLENRPGWSYYRDGQTIYRVDSRNHRVISVLALQGAPRR